MASRKQKTNRKKNARIEAGYGSKKALKKALREQNPTSILTDAEAERIINKARAGGKSLTALLPDRKKQATKKEAAKYREKSKKKQAAARKATTKREGNKRLNRVYETGENQGRTNAIRETLAGLKKGPTRVFDDGTVMLSGNTKGQWITMMGTTENYAKGEGVVMYTMKVYETTKGGGRLYRGEMFKNWDTMTTAQKKDAIAEKFADLTNDNGHLGAFYISTEREKIE